METNRKCKSDYIYIKRTIDTFYSYNRSSVKISQLYLDGRGNFNSRKVRKSISNLIKEYEAGAKMSSTVIYCFDCDNYDIDPDDERFLSEAEKYCEENGYRFVWFCREIESVYLGRQVEDSKKAKEAERFAKNNGISSVKLSSLSHLKYQNNCSNLACVLDDYLERLAPE